MVRGIRADGFSLLEILIALAMISAILLTTFQGTVLMKQSINRNHERVRTLIIAQSMAAWWMRLSPEEQVQEKEDQFSAIPGESGLLYASDYEWCVQSEGDESFLIIRNLRAGFVRLPVRLPVPRLE